MVRGEGAYVCDSRGNRTSTGSRGCSRASWATVAHDLAEAARTPGRTRSGTSRCGPTRTRRHRARREARRRSTPGDLNRVFFTSGGSEAVESAWKLARQYHRLRGEHDRYKVISRDIAYHGTTMGALTITSVIPYRTPFEPLVPGAIKVPNTNLYRAREHGDDEEAFSLWSADQIEEAILREGPETVAAVFLEPVQNAGAASRRRRVLPAGPRDLRPPRRAVRVRRGDLRVRAARHLVRRPEVRLRARHDHVREGHDERVRAARRAHRERPCRRAVPRRTSNTFLHGITFAGHPVSCAVALASIRAFETEHILEHVTALQGYCTTSSRRCARLPIVGDVRGTGYFWGIELVKDQATGDLRGRRGRAPAARLRVARAVPARAHLPLRRPRRPRGPGRAAAHLRPRGARLHGRTLREVLAEAATKR